MKLGELVEKLTGVHPDLPLVFDDHRPVGHLDSWRGRYNELTITSRGAPLTVAELLTDAREALAGRVYEGYKGGSYVMDAHTPIWADDWGDANSIAAIGLSVRADARGVPLMVIATADLSDYV